MDLLAYFRAYFQGVCFSVSNSAFVLFAAARRKRAVRSQYLPEEQGERKGTFLKRMSADFLWMKSRHVQSMEVDGIQVIEFAVGAGREWLAGEERTRWSSPVVEGGMVLPGGTRLLISVRQP